ncbi:MAG: hypothetical protein PHY92_00790 [Alphaproteobacteria bacterium]|nr:hypothetical protein [Alphaproteobacteria bacterium]
MQVRSYNKKIADIPFQTESSRALLERLNDLAGPSGLRIVYVHDDRQENPYYLDFAKVLYNGCAVLCLAASGKTPDEAVAKVIKGITENCLKTGDALLLVDRERKQHQFVVGRENGSLTFRPIPLVPRIVYSLNGGPNPRRSGHLILNVIPQPA